MIINQLHCNCLALWTHQKVRFYEKNSQNLVYRDRLKSIFIILQGDFGIFSCNLGSFPPLQTKFSSPTFFLEINKINKINNKKNRNRPLNIDAPNNLFYRNEYYINMNTCLKLQVFRVSGYLSILS